MSTNQQNEVDKLVRLVLEEKHKREALELHDLFLENFKNLIQFKLRLLEILIGSIDVFELDEETSRLLQEEPSEEERKLYYSVAVDFGLMSEGIIKLEKNWQEFIECNITIGKFKNDMDTIIKELQVKNLSITLGYSNRDKGIKSVMRTQIVKRVNDSSQILKDIFLSRISILNEKETEIRIRNNAMNKAFESFDLSQLIMRQNNNFELSATKQLTDSISWIENLLSNRLPEKDEICKWEKTVTLGIRKVRRSFITSMFNLVKDLPEGFLKEIGKKLEEINNLE